MPGVPPQGRRKAIPKPFRRPSITVSSEAPRQWRRVNPVLIQPGDIIAGHGVVHAKPSFVMWRAEDPSDISCELKFECGQPVEQYVIKHQLTFQQVYDMRNEGAWDQLVPPVLAFTRATGEQAV